MYKGHFRLAGNPFQQLPAVPSTYFSRDLQEALAHFEYARRNGESFFLLVGEVGTGKSTAIQAMLGSLDPQSPVAVLSHTSLDARELLEEVLRRFGVEAGGARSQPEVLERLERFLDNATATAPAVLIVDEAHLLSDAALEEVRLLSNLKRPGRMLLQICLVGQPELLNRLREHPLRPLRQRIAVRYVFGSLDRRETGEYIRHRLSAAGATEPRAIFSDGAADAVYRMTSGLPREINVVASQAMVNAYLENAPVVEARHVRATKHDYGFEGLRLDGVAPASPAPVMAVVRPEKASRPEKEEAKPPALPRERSPDLPLYARTAVSDDDEEEIEDLGPSLSTEPGGSGSRVRVLAIAGALTATIAAAFLLYSRPGLIDGIAATFRLYSPSALIDAWSPPPPPPPSAPAAPVADASFDARLAREAQEALETPSTGSLAEVLPAGTERVESPRPDPPVPAAREPEAGEAPPPSAPLAPPSRAATAADRLELGAHLARSGQLDEAIAAFREAVLLEPDYVNALFNLGVALLEKGEPLDAVAALRKATALAPDHGLAHRTLGIALRQSGDLAAAAAALRRAVDLSPMDAVALRHLANVLRESGEVDEAVAATRKAVTLDPGNASLLHELGFALRTAGRLEEAAIAFQQAIDLDRDFALAHYSLGVTLLDMGHRDAAEKEIAEASRLGFRPRE
jgi:general secretion pathway protein A